MYGAYPKVAQKCRTRPRASDRSIDPATTVIIIIRLPRSSESAWTIPRTVVAHADLEPFGVPRGQSSSSQPAMAVSDGLLFG
ncbi:unnamed protein product [Calypogeia fissa]